jgi:predicted amino acid dehydrogenase
LAQKLGARILGLLAFTSVIGDGGMTIARNLSIPVTTGRSLTVAIAVEGLQQAASCRGVGLGSATAAVVGATGSIGSACAELLAPMVAELILVGRLDSRLAQVDAQVRRVGVSRVRISTNIEAIRDADVVLSTTNSAQPIIQPEHLKQDAVICDVAIPSDVSPRVAVERDDVLVFEGGVVNIPGGVDFHFDFGLPSGKAYACMAETMVLALEGRYENYSIGKQMRVERVHEIAQLARKHGFKLAEL